MENWFFFEKILEFMDKVTKNAKKIIFYAGTHRVRPVFINAIQGHIQCVPTKIRMRLCRGAINRISTFYFFGLF